MFRGEEVDEEQRGVGIDEPLILGIRAGGAEEFGDVVPAPSRVLDHHHRGGGEAEVESGIA